MLFTTDTKVQTILAEHLKEFLDVAMRTKENFKVETPDLLEGYMREMVAIDPATKLANLMDFLVFVPKAERESHLKALRTGCARAQMRHSRLGQLEMPLPVVEPSESLV